MRGEVGKRALACAAAVVWLWPSAARGYRPFDSTDAAVAATGELELELQPIGLARERRERSLVSALVVNWGIAPRLELVAEGSGEAALGDGPGERGLELMEAALGLKAVLRAGCLQEAGGPSLAAEAGVRRGPGGDGAGAQGTLILSQRWDAAAVHVNGRVAWSGADGPSAGAGVIVEGPDRWPVRPAAELLAERAREGASTRTALLGAIWRLREALVLDAAVRAGRSEGAGLVELRVGLTWSPGGR